MSSIFKNKFLFFLHMSSFRFSSIIFSFPTSFFILDLCFGSAFIFWLQNCLPARELIYLFMATSVILILIERSTLVIMYEIKLIGVSKVTLFMVIINTVEIHVDGEQILWRHKNRKGTWAGIDQSSFTRFDIVQKCLRGLVEDDLIFHLQCLSCRHNVTIPSLNHPYFHGKCSTVLSPPDRILTRG